MTLKEIICYLSDEDQKIVRDMMALYEDIDRQTLNFAGQTGLHCQSGCSACCRNPDIETTAAEMMPAAVLLWAQSRAEYQLEILRSKDYKGICVFYQPEAGAHENAGCCSIYAHRPGLCRLFGFSARPDKYGKPLLVTCKTIKESQPQVCVKTQLQLHQGLEIPLLSDHALRVRNIDPAGAGKLWPMNRAIGLALEKVGFGLDRGLAAKNLPKNLQQ
jgi:Fe-S-cluster containining protein